MAAMTDLNKRLRRLERRLAPGPLIEFWVQGPDGTFHSLATGEVISEVALAQVQSDLRRQSVPIVFVDEVDLGI
jgi:hypothetical protein